MARRVVECVPNFSEGRNHDTVAALAEAVREVSGVRLAQVSADPDHHRTVLTFLGEPESVAEAAFRCARVAVERIDLRLHQGVHPRIGAVDVMPFIPLREITMSECAQLAREVGYRIAHELDVPVYFYEHSALPGKPSDLPTIRRGGFEAWVGRPLTGSRAPDAGPTFLHPTAGATIVGARGPLIAFNINLDTARVEVAQHIARTIRQQRAHIPQLAGVRALGLFLPSRGIAQVSLNLTQPEQSPLWWVVEYVRTLAEEQGVQIRETELIGLAPASAIAGVAAQSLKNPYLREEHILELWMDPEWNR
ncbi:MAG: glutamate formimidoyltransferase [Chthonomonadetes bacterium]|nr:glutamate formimidoyltransferase [Chthonomonadetes bacterium]